ncbi:MAG: NAD-binding protein [Halobacteriales archaeon]
MPTNLRVVIAGGGEVGLRTAHLLDDRGCSVVIIEKDRYRCEELTEEYVATVIEGDAARPGVLRQADLEASDVVAALTHNEAANFAVCQAATSIADIRTVMRVEQDPDEHYVDYVDGVVFPEHHGARVAANEIVGGVGVRTIEEVTGDLEIMEVEVGDDAPAAGKRLDQVRLPRGSLIISDAAGGRIGGPEMELAAGNRFIVAVESDVADEVMNLLRG